MCGLDDYASMIGDMYGWSICLKALYGTERRFKMHAIIGYDVEGIGHLV